MRIIPVLDLSKGLVVHAVKGLRQNYKAIESQICSSASPLGVIDAFLNIYDFNCIYIADLDAIENQGNNTGIVRSINEAYPDLNLWLDCGTQLIDEYSQQVKSHKLNLILSTESVQSTKEYESIITKQHQHSFILSLDFKSGNLLGNDELGSQQQLWPENVIILNLDNVGSNSGFTYPASLQNNIHQQFNIYVGGGIRNIDDLSALHKQGIKGALISTALHTKSITSNDIVTFKQSL